MGLRETLNQNPAITTGATIGLIVVILAVIIWQSVGGGGPGTPSSTPKAFYSIDDGKSWFADDASKIPPFDKGGKQAVKAMVFSCNGKQFVAWLQRYTPEAKQKIETAMKSGGGKPDFGRIDTVQMTGVEVKAPGGKDWVKQTDPAAAKIMTPDCTGTLELVSP